MAWRCFVATSALARIRELSAEGLTVYKGGYTAYEAERERRRERLALAIEAQDERRRRLQADIAMTGRQAQFAERQAGAWAPPSRT